MLPYQRLDLSVKMRFRAFEVNGEFYVQVFNAFNRRNEWFVFFDDFGSDVIKMLPIVPTLGINFNF